MKQLQSQPERDRLHYFNALNKAAQMLTLAGAYGEAEVSFCCRVAAF